jgi:hypothetical protein
MKFITSTVLLTLITSTTLIASEDSAQLAFFNSLSKLCGERYEGKMTFPKEGQDAFAGKVLVATLDSCTDNEIRIPFHVGEDRSRTWIVSKTENGLQLKHDHRHEDGTPDEITMYGGLAGNNGSSLSQSFFADEHTATIIPAASTNVWTITLSEDTSSLTYYLERHSAPRFSAELTKVSGM